MIFLIILYYNINLIKPINEKLLKNNKNNYNIKVNYINL